MPLYELRTYRIIVGKAADAPLAENSAMVSWRLDDVVSILLDSPYHHYR